MYRASMCNVRRLFVDGECRLKGKDGLTTTTVVNPFQRKAVGVLEVVDVYEGWSVTVSFSWKQCPPDNSVLQALAAAEDAKIADTLRKAKGLRLDADSWCVDAAAACGRM